MSDEAAEHASLLWLAAEGEENGPLEELVFGLGARYGGPVAIRLAKAVVALCVPAWEAQTGGDPYVRSIVDLVQA